MKRIIFIVLFVFLLSCQNQYDLQSVAIKPIKTFDLGEIDIRAMVLIDNALGFGGTKGTIGYIDIQRQTMEVSSFSDKDYRMVATTKDYFYALGTGNPALLQKFDSNQISNVYVEKHEKVFYNSMLFIDNQFGIAVGDPTENCMSIITTNDGGQKWHKKTCSQAPKLEDGEVLFAASNTNIASIKNKLWVITGGTKSNVFISEDKAQTWKKVHLPILQGTASQGAFSIDFYDEKNGIVVGGDYTNPSIKNKTGAVTTDGGKNWTPLAPNSLGYMSCVKYIPLTYGKGLVATSSSNGLWISTNGGKSWKQISQEGFHALLFADEKTMIASGKGKITLFKLIKKELR